MALSNPLKAELLLESSTAVGLDALVISDPNVPIFLSPPIRLVNNTVDVTINGNIYTASFFDLPRGVEGADPGEITLVVDDPDQAIFLRLESVPPTKEKYLIVTYYFVLDSSPDTLEITEEFDLIEYFLADDDSGRLSITLRADTYMSEEMPAHSIEPSTHPAAFRSNQ